MRSPGRSSEVLPGSDVLSGHVGCGDLCPTWLQPVASSLRSTRNRRWGISPFGYRRRGKWGDVSVSNREATPTRPISRWSPSLPVGRRSPGGTGNALRRPSGLDNDALIRQCDAISAGSTSMAPARPANRFAWCGEYRGSWYGRCRSSGAWSVHAERPALLLWRQGRHRQDARRQVAGGLQATSGGLFSDRETCGQSAAERRHDTRGHLGSE